MVSIQTVETFPREHRKVGLNSNILIYFIEAHPRYHPLARMIFEAIEAGRNFGVCSTLTLLEVLVQPYRMNDDETVNQFYGLLTTYPHLEWVELSSGIADSGAHLRAKYRLKTPDAILLATAIDSGATGFIGNDIRFKGVEELEILVLAK